MRRRLWPLGLALLLVPPLAACLGGSRVTQADLHRSAVDLMNQGAALQDEERWREAISLYERSITLAPTPAAHLHLGECHAALGDLDSAENHLQRALELSPSLALAETELLRIQSQRTEESPGAPRMESRPTVSENAEVAVRDAVEAPPSPSEEAIAAPERTVEETAPTPRPPVPNPNESAARVPADPLPRPVPVMADSRAESFPSVSEVRELLFPHLHGDEDAPSGAERLRQMRLGSPEFHLGRAAMLEESHDFLSALSEYRLALEIDPSNTEALLAMARVQGRELGHGEEAMRTFERARAAAPRDAEIPFQIGNHLYGLGEVEEAAAQYRQATDLDPLHQRAFNNLGAALRELGDDAGALEALERAAAIDPAYAAPHKNLGNVHADQGRPAEALAAYRRYVELGGSDASVVEGWIRDLERRPQ
jgi:tetratricopeptide (TPR) repeat protein